MVEGIVDGSVDVIATDHAPHHADEKMVEFDRAPFGIVGLETAVPLVFDRLVHQGRISLKRMIELLSVNAARVMNVPGGTLTEGAQVSEPLRGRADVHVDDVGVGLVGEIPAVFDQRLTGQHCARMPHKGFQHRVFLAG